MISALKKLTLVEETVTKLTVQCDSSMREVSKSSHSTAWKGLFMRWGKSLSSGTQSTEGRTFQAEGLEFLITQQ